MPNLDVIFCFVKNSLFSDLFNFKNENTFAYDANYSNSIEKWLYFTETIIVIYFDLFLIKTFINKI